MLTSPASSDWKNVHTWGQALLTSVVGGQGNDRLALERLGEIMPNSGRGWNADLIGGMREWTLVEYLRVLFLAPRGRYRIIIFVVSTQAFPRLEASVSRDEAMKWVSSWTLYLPKIYVPVPLPDDSSLTTLIY